MGIASVVAWTPEERAALVAASEEDSSCRCLVAAGGDGTVAALINERPARPITVLPAGTENLFAGHFLVGPSPEEVASTIALGRVMPMDLGCNGDRRFALMAGIGFDADVVTRHHAARIGKAGRMRPTHRAAYVEPVLRASFGYRFPTLTITTGEGESLVGTTAFLFNLPRYALGLPIAPAARGDDGLLDLVVFRDAGPLRALHYLWMVFRGLHLQPRRRGPPAGGERPAWRRPRRCPCSSTATRRGGRRRAAGPALDRRGPALGPAGDGPRRICEVGRHRLTRGPFTPS